MKKTIVYGIRNCYHEENMKFVKARHFIAARKGAFYDSFSYQLVLKLTIKMNKGWKITKVYIQKKSGSYTTERMNKTSYSKKISLTNNSGYVYVYCYNEKTKVSECLEIRDASWY